MHKKRPAGPTRGPPPVSLVAKLHFATPMPLQLCCTQHELQGHRKALMLVSVSSLLAVPCAPTLPGAGSRALLNHPAGQGAKGAADDNRGRSDEMVQCAMALVTKVSLCI